HRASGRVRCGQGGGERRGRRRVVELGERPDHPETTATALHRDGERRDRALVPAVAEGARRAVAGLRGAVGDGAEQRAEIGRLVTGAGTVVVGADSHGRSISRAPPVALPAGQRSRRVPRRTRGARLPAASAAIAVTVAWTRPPRRRLRRTASRRVFDIRTRTRGAPRRPRTFTAALTRSVHRSLQVAITRIARRKC